MNVDWYDEAEAYDLAFSFPPDRELAFLLALLERDGVTPPARLLEPMVGSGRFLPPLERAGYAVTGFDRSLAMLRLARAKSPRAALLRADAARFACAPVHDGAFCLIDSFRYLQDLSQARRFMEAMAAALKPGAPFLLGLHLEGGEPSPPEDWTTTFAGRTARVRLQFGEPAGNEHEWMRAEVTITEPGGLSRTIRSRLRQRRWSPPAFCRFLDSCEAFEVRGLYRRDHDLAHPLDALPPRGGPVIVHLGRLGGAGGDPRTAPAPLQP